MSLLVRNSFQELFIFIITIMIFLSPYFLVILNNQHIIIGTVFSLILETMYYLYNESTNKFSFIPFSELINTHIYVLVPYFLNQYFS